MPSRLKEYYNIIVSVIETKWLYYFSDCFGIRSKQLDRFSIKFFCVEVD